MISSSVQLSSFGVILGIVVTIVNQVNGGLTLNKECGEINCGAHTFCSPTDHICLPCQTICDPQERNHDQNRCEADCQDYLHDLRYSRRGNESTVFEMEIESELWTLKFLLGVTLTLTALLVILSVVILLKLQLKRTTKLKKKQMELPSVIYRNEQYEKSPPSPIRVENNNGNARFRREPSESTLPEYSTQSYDNPALSPSPTHHV